MSTLKEWVDQSTANRRSLAGETLILHVAQRIWDIMEEGRVSRAQLAALLNRTRSYVTQVLSGSSNLTLRTVAEIGDALGCDTHFAFVPREKQIAAAPVKLDRATLPNADWRDVVNDEWMRKTTEIEGDKFIRFHSPAAAENQGMWREVKTMLEGVAR